MVAGPPQIASMAALAHASSSLRARPARAAAPGYAGGSRTLCQRRGIGETRDFPTLARLGDQPGEKIVGAVIISPLPG
jgi:hypothetical protein